MANCTIQAPFFEIGPKSYLYGDDVLSLALAADAAAIVSSLRQMGLTKSEALALIEKHWDSAETTEGGIL